MMRSTFTSNTRDWEESCDQCTPSQIPLFARSLQLRNKNCNHFLEPFFLPPPHHTTPHHHTPPPHPTTTTTTTTTTTMDVSPDPIFLDIDAETQLSNMSEIESYCEACGNNGRTRLLLANIPYFRKIIIMAFYCEHCHHRDNQIQSGNALADEAITYIVKCESVDDLKRQVIRSETATINIPELELEFPCNKRGTISTVEGFLSDASRDLSDLQKQRQAHDPTVAARIQTVIDRLDAFASGSTFPFTFIVADLAGNSFVQSLNTDTGNADNRLQMRRRLRTDEETEAMGYAVDPDGHKSAEEQAALIAEQKFNPDKQGAKIQGAAYKVDQALRAKLDTYMDLDRMATVPATCPACQARCQNRMCLTEIPYFKEIILFVLSCDLCGFRDVEIKPGGSVSERGRRITLKLHTMDDLKRDILKSDHAGMRIPELQLTMQDGTLGGKYTTVEGLLQDVRSQLRNSAAFSLGDSADAEEKARAQVFFRDLDAVIEGKMPCTMILDDPLANSYIFGVNGEDGLDDDNLEMEEYERTEEQNDDLGLNDMVVDNYGTIPEEDEEDELAEADAKEASLGSTSTSTASTASATSTTSSWLYRAGVFAAGFAIVAAATAYLTSSSNKSKSNNSNNNNNN
jgi:zinc finger protein ZPR1